MTTEELLKPRFKVIADYPNQYHLIDSIIDDLFYDDEYKTEEWFDKYPMIFLKLKWWSYRTVEEMPMFLKMIKPDTQYGSNIKVGDVIKVAWYKDGYPVQFDNEHPRMYQAIEVHGEYMFYNTDRYLPATLEEYNTYLQHQQ